MKSQTPYRIELITIIMSTSGFAFDDLAELSTESLEKMSVYEGIEYSEYL